MRKSALLLLLLLAVQLPAQVISSSRWTDLFSYNNVLAIREDNGKLIAATENGIFYYTLATGEITKLSKANGLHEVKISAFDYNPENKIGLVGYQNGSLDVITPEGITYVVDIPIATGYNGNKKINHISITGNLAVISVGYGVSIFRLDRKEFADSSFFTNSGQYEAAREAIIKDNTVYAATASGLKSHEINTTFAIYSTWGTLADGNISHVANSDVLAFTDGSVVRYGKDNVFNVLPGSFSGIQDVVVSGGYIVVTDMAGLSVYTAAGAFIRNHSTTEALNTGIYASNSIFAGTRFSGIKTESGNSLKPDGPYHSTSYKITLQDDKIWVSTGNRGERYNTALPSPLNLGFYHYTGTEWVYPSYFRTSGFGFNVMDVVANPADLTEVFFTNYSQQVGQGTYKMKYNSTSKDFDFVKVYTTGSGPSYGRPVGLAFDDKNNLYGSVAFLDIVNPTGDDTGLMAYDRAADVFRYKSLQIGSGVQKPVISDGLIWIPTPRTRSRLAAVDYKGTTSVNDDMVYVMDINNGFPSNSQGVISVAIDKSGDAWIGTDNGLRVLQSAASSIKDKPKAEPVIIEENGVGEELFRDTSILQIAVDGGNQKWVSVNGGGVFFLSATGEQTIKHFTKENSPLPNNSVTDIKVDNKTGKVYFVTLDGIMVYQGDVLNVTENFGEVLVYPNPVVAAKYKENVKIRGLAEKTNIRITDAAGNLVHQAVSRGGYYEWNLNNHRGVRVASGIYYVLMTNADGTDTATAKIAVVN